MKDGGTGKANYTKSLAVKPSLSGGIGSEDCNIAFTTYLQKLQPALADYRVDDVLIVDIDSSGNVIASGKHGICGTIAAPETLQLKQCLDQGKKYKSTILEITTVSCKVRVRRLLS
ncbi:hypothetical protein EA772_14330 [Pedobacter sp. G11]|uniref:hypothetical protein n=1 Tax=Pedobacter sp. G11 TaxID=2482728 RepID=UPI000F5E5E83|nr:hypothetical protein [Pedobacter sp. G11]AZI26456.1 hypothetical protein EA772_14330 [Pedobacter sp. G11]